MPVSNKDIKLQGKPRRPNSQTSPELGLIPLEFLPTSIRLNLHVNCMYAAEVNCIHPVQMYSYRDVRVFSTEFHRSFQALKAADTNEI